MCLAKWAMGMSSNTVCISLHTNALGKGMNPSLLPPIMGK